MLRWLFARFAVRDADGALVLVPELDAAAVEELTAEIVATKRAALRLTSNANGLLIARFADPPLRALIESAFAPIPVSFEKPAHEATQAEPVPLPRRR